MKRVSLFAAVATVTLVVSLIVAGFAGLGSQRAESQYSGHVVDVVEDKGVLLRPTWVNMKTDPRSSDVQRYCVHPSDDDELVPKFYDAMESGDRYTVTYSRPLWVSPTDCPQGTAIIDDVRPAGA